MKNTLVVLGITQLIGWGTLYYSFSLFVTPIHQDIGWSYSRINSATTVSLICWALLAPFVGKLLHSKGAKFVMSLGSALATVGLFLWAFYPNNFPVFLFSWMLIGVSMSMVLYESAFAVITTRFESSYNKGISLLTIIGGLASTIFIPLIQFSIDSTGFENTIWLLGFLNAFICFPLHFFYIPGSKLKTPRSDESLVHVSIRKSGVTKTPAFWGLLIWFSTYAVMTSGFSFLLVPLLLDLGAGKKSVVFMMALIGVMQVVGRLIFLFAKADKNLRKFSFLLNASFLVSIVFLLYTTHYYALIVFAIFYGSAKGMMSVIKGTATADMFSLQLYTRVNGILSGTSGILKAVAPLLLSLLWTIYQTGDVVLYVLLLITLIGYLGIFKLKSNNHQLSSI